VHVLGGDYIGERYLTNYLPWMTARTSVREMFNGEA